MTLAAQEKKASRKARELRKRERDLRSLARFARNVAPVELRSTLARKANAAKQSLAEARLTFIKD